MNHGNHPYIMEKMTVGGKPAEGRLWRGRDFSTMAFSFSISYYLCVIGTVGSIDLSKLLPYISRNIRLFITRAPDDAIRGSPRLQRYSTSSHSPLIGQLLVSIFVAHVTIAVVRFL